MYIPLLCFPRKESGIEGFLPIRPAMPCHAEKSSSERMPRVFLLGLHCVWLGCKNLSLLSILSLLTPPPLFFFTENSLCHSNQKCIYFLLTHVWGLLVSKDWTLTVYAHFQEYTGITQTFKFHKTTNADPYEHPPFFLKYKKSVS